MVNVGAAKRLLSLMKTVLSFRAGRVPVGGRSTFSVKNRGLSFGSRKVGFRMSRRGSRCRMSERSSRCR